MNADDTIAAISSAVGPALRMIVRVSGRKSRAIARSLVAVADADDNDRSARAVRGHLSFAAMSVPAWVYSFHAPRSYTGEDLVEFHLPGNPLLVRMLLDELIARGARAAEPGEFTARAYFNGRMDLTQAEGVAAIVSAHGEQELAAARQLLAGELARRLRPPMDRIAETLALVEVGIDFSEEDVSFLSADEIARRASDIDDELRRLTDESPRFERLAHEPRIVLVGRPNAGKSTLLNALAGWERAVVSPVAGTTRDVLSAEAALTGGIVTLLDAAGLEEQAPPQEDTAPPALIARQMHERALAAVESADVVLLVEDAADDRPRIAPPRAPDLVVLTKIDLLIAPPATNESVLAVSARTGEGLDGLRHRLSDLAFAQTPAPSGLALNVRHRQSIQQAREALARVPAAAHSSGPEVVALELREALDALGRVLGQITPDDVLGRVFATFCIGK